LGTPGGGLPPGFVQHIVATTAPSSCTNSQRIVVSLSTGNAFPLACRSWLCDACSSKKWLAARVLFERGILAAFARGERVRFLTLTDGSKHGTMTVHDLSQAWVKLATMLRKGGPPLPRPPKGSGKEAQAKWRRQCKARKPLLSEYAMVLEVGSKGQGRLHAHVLFTGRYIKQSRLSTWAKQAGFGRVVDIREVPSGDAAAAAAYAAKLAYYGAKQGQAVAKLKRLSRVRIRPIRKSHGWYPGGLRKVEEELGIRKAGGSKDPGPWVLITHDGKGRAIGSQFL
jgi:hypothetical protein